MVVDVRQLLMNRGQTTIFPARRGVYGIFSRYSQYKTFLSPYAKASGDGSPIFPSNEQPSRFRPYFLPFRNPQSAFRI